MVLPLLGLTNLTSVQQIQFLNCMWELCTQEILLLVVFIHLVSTIHSNPDLADRYDEVKLIWQDDPGEKDNKAHYSCIFKICDLHLTWSKFHPPTNRRIGRWRFEPHCLPISWLNVLWKKLKLPLHKFIIIRMNTTHILFCSWQRKPQTTKTTNKHQLTYRCKINTKYLLEKILKQFLKVFKEQSGDSSKSQSQCIYLGM